MRLRPFVRPVKSKPNLLPLNYFAKQMNGFLRRKKNTNKKISLGLRITRIRLETLPNVRNSIRFEVEQLEAMSLPPLKRNQKSIPLTTIPLPRVLRWTSTMTEDAKSKPHLRAPSKAHGLLPAAKTNFRDLDKYTCPRSPAYLKPELVFQPLSFQPRAEARAYGPGKL